MILTPMYAEFVPLDWLSEIKRFIWDFQAVVFKSYLFSCFVEDFRGPLGLCAKGREGNRVLEPTYTTSFY